MRFILILCLLIIYSNCFCQHFDPYAGSEKTSYKFNLEKNFFKTDLAYKESFSKVTTELSNINSSLNKNYIDAGQWIKLIQQYNSAEADYRVIDLYLFSRFVINTTDERADKESDSLRSIIRTTRTLIQQKIYTLPEITIKQIIKTKPLYEYYFSSIKRNKDHLPGAEKEKILEPFQYLKNAGYYDAATAAIVFDKVETKDGPMDVRQQMSTWQTSPDEKVRRQGSIAFFKGYESKRNVIGPAYIQMIKGLNAFSRAKSFSGLIDEKLFSYQLSSEILGIIFKKIIQAAGQQKTDTAIMSLANDGDLRYRVTEVDEILTRALGVLGKEYTEELKALLNPANGRIDIVGGKNRYPIRGTASVYPVNPSIFYAANYEGYLIDLIILAHESGHAVQASLMKKNNVSLLYASGPGYFTESFGKFNEILLFDYLSTFEKDAAKKKTYTTQLKERLNVLYGSTEEAYIEYSLIKGISTGYINTPDDLDSVTQTAGSEISSQLYKDEPERKGLWLVMETNYHDPMHNINDMVGSALAINYYKMYKENKEKFLQLYVNLLKEGYDNSPSELLKKINIDMQSPGFINGVIEFLQSQKQ